VPGRPYGVCTVLIRAPSAGMSTVQTP